MEANIIMEAGKLIPLLLHVCDGAGAGADWLYGPVGFLYDIALLSISAGWMSDVME